MIYICAAHLRPPPGPEGVLQVGQGGLDDGRRLWPGTAAGWGEAIGRTRTQREGYIILVFIYHASVILLTC